MKRTAITLGEVLLIGALTAAPALAQNPAPEAQPPQPMTASGQDTSAAPQANQTGQHHHRNHAPRSHRERSTTQPNVGTETNPAAQSNSAEEPNADAGSNPAAPDTSSAPRN